MRPLSGALLPLLGELGERGSSSSASGDGTDIMLERT
jgi:hypothetical protein